MKIITKYKSDDGREFLDMDACIKYEDLCRKVSEIMSELSSIPDLPSCDFANGAGYVQHDAVTAKKARVAILKIVDELMPHKWFKSALSDELIDSSWVSRLIGEMSERCLQDAWHRFACMTRDYKEYGQPYYAKHPSEAKDICLNSKAKD